jgi:hypothetical protein
VRGVQRLLRLGAVAPRQGRLGLAPAGVGGRKRRGPRLPGARARVPQRRIAAAGGARVLGLDRRGQRGMRGAGGAVARAVAKGGRARARRGRPRRARRARR